MSKTDSSLDRRRLVSLNIDVANLPREAIERLVQLAPNQGRVLLSHAFGDFRREDMDELAVQLYLYGFRLIHCPAWPNQRGRLKSVVDDVMAQDMRDQMEYAPNIEVYILGSGDRNFIAVANAIKRHGKKVVVAADQESINKELRLCADEFLPLPRNRGRSPLHSVSRLMPPPIVQPEPEPEPEPEYEIPTRVELLEQVRRLADVKDYLTVRRIIQALLPEGIHSGDRLRSTLANRLQELIDAGYLRIERRVIRGRGVNTLVISAVAEPLPTEPEPEPETATATSPEAAAPATPAAAPRRRSRRKVSVPAAS